MAETGWYSNGIKHVCDGTIDYVNDTVKCAILLSSYTFDGTNQEGHDYYDDVSASVATGCTPQALPATKAISINTSDDKIYFDCGASVTFSGVTSGQSVASIVVYEDTGTGSTSGLMCHLQFTGGAFDTNGQDITVNFNSNGVASIGYSIS